MSDAVLQARTRWIARRYGVSITVAAMLAEIAFRVEATR